MKLDKNYLCVINHAMSDIKNNIVLLDPAKLLGFAAVNQGDNNGLGVKVGTKVGDKQLIGRVESPKIGLKPGF